ncbi:hypothetical protein Droror1_Dr00025512 [Drosera rotundifolia]
MFGLLRSGPFGLGVSFRPRLLSAPSLLPLPSLLARQIGLIEIRFLECARIGGNHLLKVKCVMVAGILKGLESQISFAFGHATRLGNTDSPSSWHPEHRFMTSIPHPPEPVDDWEADGTCSP